MNAMLAALNATPGIHPLVRQNASSSNSPVSVDRDGRLINDATGQAVPTLLLGSTTPTPISPLPSTFYARRVVLTDNPNTGSTTERSGFFVVDQAITPDGSTAYGSSAIYTVQPPATSNRHLIGHFVSLRTAGGSPSSLAASTMRGLRTTAAVSAGDQVTTQEGLYTEFGTDLSSVGGTVTASAGTMVRYNGGATCTFAAGFRIRDSQGSNWAATNEFAAISIDLNTRNFPLYSGISISGNSGATTAYGIWLRSNTANVSSGIAFGASADTTLFRGAANQLLTPGDWSARHYLSSATPTVAAGAAAGTGPTISISGTDHGFAVSLTTGISPTINATLFTVTYGATWTSSAAQVTCAPGNAAAASLATGATPFVSAVGTTTMTFTSNGTALAATTAYVWRFTAMR